MQKLKEDFEKKILSLSSGLPRDFESLKSITVDNLLNDANRLPEKARGYLEKNKDFLTQYEGLTQLTSEYYKKNISAACHFNKAIFYNDLWKFVIFHEFWKNFIDKLNTNSLPSIKQIGTILKLNLINKIRNSIAHFDVDFEKEQVALNDKNYQRTFKIAEIVNLTNWLLTVLIVMAHNQKIQRT